MQNIGSICYNSETDIFIFRWKDFSHCINISIWRSLLIVMDFDASLADVTYKDSDFIQEGKESIYLSNSAEP